MVILLIINSAVLGCLLFIVVVTLSIRLNTIFTKGLFVNDCDLSQYLFDSEIEVIEAVAKVINDVVIIETILGKKENK